jgi:hypothetical protein
MENNPPMTFSLDAAPDEIESNAKKKQNLFEKHWQETKQALLEGRISSKKRKMMSVIL